VQSARDVAMITRCTTRAHAPICPVAWRTRSWPAYGTSAHWSTAPAELSIAARDGFCQLPARYSRDTTAPPSDRPRELARFIEVALRDRGPGDDDTGPPRVRRWLVP